MIKTANIVGSTSRKGGGVFESVRRLSQALDARGMEVRVFGAEDEFTEADRSAWRPVSVCSLRGSGKLFGYSRALFEHLVSFQPDVTHSHSLWETYSLAVTDYGRSAARPYLVSPHGMLDRWALRQSRLKKAAALLLYASAHLNGASCLRALCEPELNALREFGLRRPVCVIGSGVDVPSNSAAGRRQAQRTPGGGTDWVLKSRPELPRVLLSLGRIHRKKGLGKLLRAWALCQEAAGADQWLLALAGWDQEGHESELKRLATELEIKWAVSRLPAEKESSGLPGAEWLPKSEAASLLFLGPRFEAAKAACYHRCDAFILPSLSEGLPMAVLEAWAHAKPVLMTPQCNLPEGFAADAALRIDPSVQGIAAGLRTLFQLSERSLLAMGLNGRRLVEQRFSWEKIGRDMEEVYRWLAGGGPAPGCVVLP